MCRNAPLRVNSPTCFPCYFSENQASRLKKQTAPVIVYI